MTNIMYADSFDACHLTSSVHFVVEVAFGYGKYSVGWPDAIKHLQIILNFFTENFRHGYSSVTFLSFWLGDYIFAADSLIRLCDSDPLDDDPTENLSVNFGSRLINEFLEEWQQRKKTLPMVLSARPNIWNGNSTGRRRRARIPRSSGVSLRTEAKSKTHLGQNLLSKCYHSSKQNPEPLDFPSGSWFPPLLPLDTANLNLNNFV